MAIASMRLRVLGIAALFVATACSGGFGGASATPAASTAPSADTATAEPSASEAAEPVVLKFIIGEVEMIQTTTRVWAEAYTAQHPNVTFEFDVLPGGTEGDTLLKSRLATGDGGDLIWYNSGSLLQGLNPSQSLVDISAEPFIANIAESFLPTVAQGDQIFGVPAGTAMGGGILYNKKIFADQGLEVPTSWADFAANNDKLKAAGIAPVGATFADTWTSQLFVLADNCNVQAAMPDWAEKYTANEAKYATTPAALNGFKRLEEGFEKGWFQEDFGAATFDDGLNMLAEGEIAQYPMLTFAVGTIAEIHPDVVADIGYFGIPGDDASQNCATIWMPSAIYIAKTTQNLDVAKDFLAFVATPEASDILTAAIPPTGPYLINGSKLPDDVLPVVNDIQAYVDAGKTAPALEFLSPIKGPALETLTVAVGSGLNSAEEGAALYDQDVEKQAQQLGLPGW